MNRCIVVSLGIFIVLLVSGPKFALAQKKFSSVKYPFSRVFTSSEQRAILDRQRYGLAKNQQLVNSGVVEGGKSTLVKKSKEAVTLSGIVVRDDGTHTVWINGKSELSKAPLSSVTKARLEKSNNNVVINVGKRKQSLRSGQVWLVDENKVKESFELRQGKPNSLIKHDDKQKSDQEQKSSNLAPDVGELIQSAKSIREAR